MRYTVIGWTKVRMSLDENDQEYWHRYGFCKQYSSRTEAVKITTALISQREDWEFLSVIPRL